MSMCTLLSYHVYEALRSPGSVVEIERTWNAIPKILKNCAESSVLDMALELYIFLFSSSPVYNVRSDLSLSCQDCFFKP
jgi:hypothetical protein